MKGWKKAIHLKKKKKKKDFSPPGAICKTWYFWRNKNTWLLTYARTFEICAT